MGQAGLQHIFLILIVLWICKFVSYWQWKSFDKVLEIKFHQGVRTMFDVHVI